MPRLARMILSGEPAVYHGMSRTVLDGFVLGDIKRLHVEAAIEHYYGNGKAPTDGQLPMLRQKWSSLSEYVKEIKRTC